MIDSNTSGGWFRRHSGIMIVESRGDVLVRDAMETILSKMIFERVLERDGIEIHSIADGLMECCIKDYHMGESRINFFPSQYSTEIVRIVKPKKDIRKGSRVGWGGLHTVLKGVSPVAVE
jgi:hypothetical protein